ncbi:MAG: response regulator [Terriglobia bacterium]|jgi:DNA-binding NtrC family response regulator|nr:response regulator [Terriglobia bacterium]
MRPALLVAEHEPDSALSTRKLLLETAKFNVITAHSMPEAKEAMHLMGSGIAGLVVTSSLGPENDCATLAKAFKEEKPESPVIYLSPTGFQECRWADHQLSTYEPEKLLDLVRELFGDPRTSEPPTKGPPPKGKK